MAADTVLGNFNRDRLPEALAALHRGGYGPNIRVMDPARGALLGQLQRAGIMDASFPDVEARLLVMVFSPGRVPRVVDLLQRAGASDIQVVERASDASPAPLFRSPVPQKPRARNAIRPTIPPPTVDELPPDHH